MFARLASRGTVAAIVGVAGIEDDFPIKFLPEVVRQAGNRFERHSQQHDFAEGGGVDRRPR